MNLVLKSPYTGTVPMVQCSQIIFTSRSKCTHFLCWCFSEPFGLVRRNKSLIKTPKFFGSVSVRFNLNPFENPEFVIEISHTHTPIQKFSYSFNWALSLYLSWYCKRIVTTGCLSIFNFQSANKNETPTKNSRENDTECQNKDIHQKMVFGTVCAFE